MTNLFFLLFSHRIGFRIDVLSKKRVGQASPHVPFVPGTNTILTSIPTHRPVLPSCNELYSK